MAAAVGCGSASGSWVEVMGSRRNFNKNNNNNNNNKEKKGFRVCCVSSSYSSAVSDPYKTLRIQPGATETEVRKAFRQLALQYHPDVCRGSNCGIQFHQINEAYDIVMNRVRDERSTENDTEEDVGTEEGMRGMFDEDWDMWEEWMGWEGAGIRDYSSHINPYI